LYLSIYKLETSDTIDSAKVRITSVLYQSRYVTKPQYHHLFTESTEASMVKTLLAQADTGFRHMMSAIVMTQSNF